MPIATLLYSAQHHSNFNGDLEKVSADDEVYAGASAIGQEGYIQWSNLPSDVHTINSIRVYIKDANISHANRTATAVLRTRLEDNSQNAYYTEDITVGTKIDFFPLTERTTSDGSAAWTISEVNNIELYMTALSAVPDIGSGLLFDYVYIEVDYNLAPAVTYPNTSHRIIMDGGTVILDGGTIILD